MREQIVQLLLMRKLAHFHSILDRSTRSPNTGCTLCDVYRTDFQVKIRRESPVEADFLLTEEGTELRRAQVDKRKADRPFDLVGKHASQQDPGNVSRHQGHPLLHRMRVSL